MIFKGLLLSWETSLWLSNQLVSSKFLPWMFHVHKSVVPESFRSQISHLNKFNRVYMKGIMLTIPRAWRTLWISWLFSHSGLPPTGGGADQAANPFPKRQFKVWLFEFIHQHGLVVWLDLNHWFWDGANSCRTGILAQEGWLGWLRVECVGSPQLTGDWKLFALLFLGLEKLFFFSFLPFWRACQSWHWRIFHLCLGSDNQACCSEGDVPEDSLGFCMFHQAIWIYKQVWG